MEVKARQGSGEVVILVSSRKWDVLSGSYLRYGLGGRGMLRRNNGQ